MAVGLAPAVANAILDALCRSVAWSEPAELWVKLHIGDPGAAGTANPAGETDRVQAIFASGAAGGAISNTTALQWTGVSNAEDYTHWSAWDSNAAGNFQFSGLMTANAVLIGDNFSIPVGDLDVTLTVAA